MNSEDIFIGCIEVAVPSLGVAIVATTGGSASRKAWYIASIPGADSDVGTAQNWVFPEGTDVLCVRNPNVAFRAFIVAPLNWSDTVLQTATKSRALYALTRTVSANDPVFNNVLDQKLSLYTNPFDNQSHCADIDALPGDYDVIDQQNLAGLHVGRLVANMHSSPISFIDSVSMTNKIRQVADAIEQHTLTSMLIQSAALRVNNQAISELEAFGSLDGPALSVDEETQDVSLTDPSAVPFYRLQEASGAAIDGSERIILGNIENKTHTAKTEPPILAKERVSLSGEMTRASALGIASIKTPEIVGIHQLGYGQDGQDDLLTPFEREELNKRKTAKVSTDVQISDAAINMIIDRLLTGDYLERLCERMAEKGLLVSSKEASVQGMLSQQKDESTIVGPTPAQEYTLPQSIAIKDPVTGRTQQYYATSSFITQEADGSILICDGYGSEIRMCRGNIYISPALDLFLRPGRDLSAMVPGHQAFNAQGTCTINSADAMYIRAVKDLKIAGATGKAGTVTLESYSVGTSSVPGGMVIRSQSNLAVSGRDILIARANNRSNTKGTMQQCDEAGSIIIDSGKNGSLYATSGEVVLNANNTTIGSLDGEVNSAITINQGVIGVYAQQVLAPTNIVMVGIDGAETVTIPVDGKTAAIQLSTVDTPNILIAGSCVVGGNFKSNGTGVFCEDLVARGIASTLGVVSSIDKPFRVFQKYTMPVSRANHAYGKNLSALVKVAYKGVYQDYYIAVNAFAFPETYTGVPTHIRVPGMVWQTRTEKSGDKHYWQEPYIVSIDGTQTACYPGIQAWNTATISKENYVEAPLRTSYIVNTQRS